MSRSSNSLQHRPYREMMVGRQRDRERAEPEPKNPEALGRGAGGEDVHDAQVLEDSLPQLLHLGCADLLANVELDPEVPREPAANRLR